MNSYEVTFEVDGEIRSEILSAATPVEAASKFQKETEVEGAVVLCVVRQ